ncbi:MAG TPA: CaiB/BaiF CoA-transferase family protein [Euzebyales bacterium]|nr:CaiB/BaiF CoA-transferase family protein [Euzebyales bacterium]
MVIEGPLQGIAVVEFAGIGPAPFACMLLADLGCDVIRVTRPGHRGGVVPDEDQILHRGRAGVDVDLRSAAGRRTAQHLVERTDVLVEGFRPGAMERLGLGPDACMARNPRLIYARVTGWGQDGPLAQRAGHDINYLALSGALSLIGPRDGGPVVPLNLLADFGGGGMLLVAGILAALLERERSDRGQVVDAAMVDGVGLLLAMTWSLRNAGLWRDERGGNLLDGGAPFYDTYLCADGGYVALGALEPQFYARFLDGIAAVADTSDWPDRHDPTRWPHLRARIAAAFLTRTRDAWAGHFADRDACVTPVLTLDEAARHPHLQRRAAYGTLPSGAPQPAAAPRFSRTGARTGATVDRAAALHRWGLAADGTVTPP